VAYRSGDVTPLSREGHADTAREKREHKGVGNRVIWYPGPPIRGHRSEYEFRFADRLFVEAGGSRVDEYSINGEAIQTSPIRVVITPVWRRIFDIHGTGEGSGKYTTSRVHGGLLLFVSLFLFPLQEEKPSEHVVGVDHWGDYLGGPQPALTFVPSAELCVAEGFSSFEAALLLGDFAWCLGGRRRWKSQVDAGCSGVEILALYRPKR